MANLSSSTRAAPSTPIRAIQSSLSTRITPSVPPATTAYEPLVKAVFTNRLRTVLGSSAVVAWGLVNIWRVWQNGQYFSMSSLTSSVGPLMWIYGGVEWALVALPALLLHKLFLNDRKTSAISAYETLKMAAHQRRTQVALAAYFASAVASLVIHVFMAYSFERDLRGDPKLTVFVKSRKHPYYLNGRFLYLVFVQFVAATTFVLRAILIDRFAYQWSNTLSFRRPSKILVGITSTFVALLFATASVVGASLVFAVCRLLLPIIYRVPFVAFFIRPLTAHFLRGAWTLSLPISSFTLLIRAWFLAFTTLFMWEVADSLFESIVSETAPVSLSTADPNLAIVSGVTSSNRVFKFFAYTEAQTLAKATSPSSTAQRSALYGDQKSSLNLWAVFVRESLLLLGQDYQLFLRRGKPAPPPPLSAPVAPTTTKTPIGTPLPLLRSSIYKAPPGSPGRAALDALASDGPLARAVDAGAKATHVPELFRSVEAEVTSTPLEEVGKEVAVVKSKGGLAPILKSSLCSVVGSCLPPQVREAGQAALKWFAKERVDKAVEASLPFKELDVLVVDALSHLVCASLTEDRYGMVQRDIPRILEAFILFLVAVEERQAEIASMQPPADSPDAEALQHQLEKAKYTLSVASDGLKDGIGAIVRTFGDKLLAFKFPPRIAQKLQLFLEHC